MTAKREPRASSLGPIGFYELGWLGSAKPDDVPADVRIEWVGPMPFDSATEMYEAYHDQLVHDMEHRRGHNFLAPHAEVVARFDPDPVVRSRAERIIAAAEIARRRIWKHDE